jgi:hypothetical protein
VTPEDEKTAQMILAYLAKHMPDKAWAINSRDEMLAAIAFVESYHG